MPAPSHLADAGLIRDVAGEQIDFVCLRLFLRFAKASDTILSTTRFGSKLRHLRLRKSMGLVELGKPTGLSPALQTLSECSRNPSAAVVYGTKLMPRVPASHGRPVFGRVIGWRHPVRGLESIMGVVERWQEERFFGSQFDHRDSAVLRLCAAEWPALAGRKSPEVVGRLNNLQIASATKQAVFQMTPDSQR